VLQAAAACGSDAEEPTSMDAERPDATTEGAATTTPDADTAREDARPAGDGSSTSSPADAAPDATFTGDPGTCGSGIVNVAPAIRPTDLRAMPMPSTDSATGGTLVSGMYFMTEYRFYEGAGAFYDSSAGKDFRWMLVVDATRNALSEWKVPGPGPHYVDTYTTDQAKLSFTYQFCLADAGTLSAGTAIFPYSASATTFLIYNPTARSIQVYTKQ